MIVLFINVGNSFSFLIKCWKSSGEKKTSHHYFCSPQHIPHIVTLYNILHFLRNIAQLLNCQKYETFDICHLINLLAAALNFNSRLYESFSAEFYWISWRRSHGLLCINFFKQYENTAVFSDLFGNKNCCKLKLFTSWKIHSKNIYWTPKICKKFCIFQSIKKSTWHEFHVNCTTVHSSFYLVATIKMFSMRIKVLKGAVGMSWYVRIQWTECLIFLDAFRNAKSIFGETKICMFISNKYLY